MKEDSLSSPIPYARKCQKDFGYSEKALDYALRIIQTCEGPGVRRKEIEIAAMYFGGLANGEYRSKREIEDKENAGRRSVTVVGYAILSTREEKLKELRELSNAVARIENLLRNPPENVYAYVATHEKLDRMLQPIEREIRRELVPDKTRLDTAANFVKRLFDLS